jgi:hypothetical protein
MMRLLSLAVVLSAATLALPALACERHQSHAALTVAESAPPPEPVIIEPVQIEPASAMAVQKEVDLPQSSKAIGAAYENCMRNRKDQTVYYTQ